MPPPPPPSPEPAATPPEPGRHPASKDVDHVDHDCLWQSEGSSNTVDVSNGRGTRYLPDAGLGGIQ
jgi:hypothetical protein